MLLVLAVLVLAAGALSQKTNVTCNSDTSILNNHLGQNPCLVTAYLLTPCATPIIVGPPQTGVYGIPGTGLPSNQSTCSSVTYMMLSACSACQGITANPPAGFGTWIALGPLTYINPFSLSIPIPDGTAIPAWAFDDLVNNGFDLGLVEVQASANSTSPAGPTSQQSGGGGKSTPVGAVPDLPIAKIVGGVIGGLAALVLGALAVWFILRRTRTRPVHETVESSFVGGHKTGPSQGSVTSWWPPSHRDGTSPAPTHVSPGVTQPLKLYDPDDPSTFPPRLPEAHGFAAA
ncbi:hypothetical protein EXIGLDRAFT_732361 [Exidia glandulosa HHB12029]|uniref:Uncharacterized protein n=1 Tax=Exidia glandulosa HHB12029 TaxID=1314781 RepID=A0A165KSB2_EXIGL|nr:hypothetical protein EXIGLDRAFT_732361 [Exidia glandulosa HHB12029]